MKKYKVRNLKEEKLVYFSVYDMSDYELKEYYPFYPGESPPYSYEHDFSNLTIFEIFNVNTQKNERNVRLYKFEPNQEYIIYIHCLKNYDSYYHYEKYLFFPLTHSHVRKLTGEENIIIPKGPMFGIVNSNIQKDFEITSFNYINFDVEIKKGEANNTIFLFIPKNFENKPIYFSDEFFHADNLTTLTIPAHKSIVLYKDLEFFYDYFYTYKSEFKNMRYIYFDINEDTDYISHNYGEILLFISKKDKDCNITINRYSPKFARLRANSSLLFENIYINGMSLYNYLKLTQMNIRISANYLPFSEFHNVYNYQNAMQVIMIYTIYNF